MTATKETQIMPHTNEDVQTLTACTEWLQKSIREWTDTHRVVDVGGAQSFLEQRLTAVQQQCTARRMCFPVKVALQLQLRGQECWNATFLLSWVKERCSLKHHARLLAAYLFLAGHQLFAAPEVFEAHISHHRDEAEKCILMCLKVSKTLVNDGAAEEAQRMLAWAAAVVAACRGSSRVKTAQYALEIHFTQLHVLWASGQYAEAYVVAEKLIQETQHSITYREALFEFIYNTGVNVLCGGEEANEEKSRVAKATTGRPSTDCHRETQKLLALSLQLQSQTAARSVKLQRFLGVTELQLSCSFLATGAYAKAVDAAAAAYQHLHTIEPLIVRLKAEALRHDTAEATRLFRLVCTQHEANIAFAELCAIAADVVNENPEAEKDVSALLQNRLSAAPTTALTAVQEEDHFRFLCFLLHLQTVWSTRELLRCLTIKKEPLKQRFHGFFFHYLWQRAVSDRNVDSIDADKDAAVPTVEFPLPAELKWQCLDVALSQFAECGSTEVERQSVLLDMTRLAIEMQPSNPSTQPHKVNEEEGYTVQPLAHTWELWTTVEPSRPALRIPALLAQAQLAFLLEKRSEGLQRVQDLWSGGDEKEDAKVRCCAALINFLLERSLLDIAGCVAQHCLQNSTAQSPQCILDFAKVCALGCLASGEQPMLIQVAELLVLYVCSLLSGGGVTLTEPATLWWARFLWYTSDRVLEVSPEHAVRLSYTAVCLHQKHITTAADDSVRTMLKQRVAALLETEFDLYVDEQPALMVAELQGAHAFLASLLTELSSPMAESENSKDEGRLFFHNRINVLLQLTNIEVRLRELAELGESADLNLETMHLDFLPGLPSIDVEDLEQAAAVCHRVAENRMYVCIPLSRAAVSLQIAAAELQWRRCVSAGHISYDGLCVTLSMLYTAYSMSSELDTKATVMLSLLNLLKDDGTTPSFAELLSAVLKTRFFDDLPGATGAAVATAEHATRLAETVVEFFAVEAWNTVVQWNVLERRDEVARWHAWALTLADMLDTTNASKVAIADLASQMPLL